VEEVGEEVEVDSVAESVIPMVKSLDGKWAVKEVVVVKVYVILE
jgi:hypothetical protein